MLVLALLAAAVGELIGVGAGVAVSLLSSIDREGGMDSSYVKRSRGWWDVEGLIHVVEAVGYDRFVVEPGAIACLPFGTADHAEFGAAATAFG